MDIGRYLSTGLNLTFKQPVPLIAGGLLVFLISCASLGLLALPLYGGLMMMYMRANAGQRIQIGDIFKYLNKTVPLFIALIVIAVLLTIGFILLVIPGLILAARWFYVIPLMVDRDMALGAAMSRSAEMMREKGGLGMHILAFVVIWVIQAAGGMLWLVPSLVTFPLTAGFYALAYADRK